MGLDPANDDPAYRLGRLFALVEGIQRAALPGLNATIKDKYFGAAAATPARVVPMLLSNATHHLALLRKNEGGGLAHWFDQQLGEVIEGLSPEFPRSLPLEDQGKFAIGYYHQRWTRRDKDVPADELIEDHAMEGAE